LHKVGNRFVIEDLSSNGTYINDILIGRQKKSLIQDGDKVFLLVESKDVKKSEQIGFVISIL
jgi:pSer/pThr/pTyr-binding forkhead associated (FHA) protein